MFEEKYRRDNERLHAPAGALEKIKERVGEQPSAPRYRTWTRYMAVAAALLLVVGGTMGVLLSQGAKLAAPETNNADRANMLTSSAGEAISTEAAVEGLTVPADYGELYDAINDMWTASGSGYGRGVLTGGVAEDGMAAPSASEEGSKNSGPSPVATSAPATDTGADYSDTNVQVAGVDEADIVKTDGTYIYYTASGELYIMKAAGADTKLVSRTVYINQEEKAYWESPLEMYLSDGRLVLLVSATNYTWKADSGSQDATYAVVFDVSDPASPKRITALGQSGYYTSSRMVGGMLYLITTQAVYGNIIRDNPITYCPVLYRGAEASTVPAGDICIRTNGETTAYTVVSSIDVAKAETHTAVKAMLGGSDTVYATAEHLLVAASSYRYEQGEIEKDKDGKNVRITRSSTDTSFVLFSLDGGKIEQLATATLPGRLLNQFSMDEYDGVYRIVTTVSEWEERVYTDGVDTYEYDDLQYNCLYTLDGSLKTLGVLEKIAEDEQVKSVRFDGTIGYFVTFRQTDPLFAVDLSDPKSPKILSALKIPGFSEYLHLFSTDRLLGIGYQADERTGWRLGVKLSMFDTSDKTDVKEKATLAVDADWTYVGSNHKAILVNAARNIIAFPADTNYLVYSYTDAQGFAQKARIEMGNETWGVNTRGLFIGDWLYVLGESGVHVVALDTYKTAKIIRF